MLDLLTHKGGTGILLAYETAKMGILFACGTAKMAIPQELPHYLFNFYCLAFSENSCPS